MNKIFTKIHVKISLYNSLLNTSNDQLLEGLNYFDDNNIRLKLCKNLDVDYKGEFVTDFEASLADEDVITIFNSKIYQNPPHLSLEILGNIEKNSEKNVNPEPSKQINYCIELKTYEKKLPFICKLDLQNLKPETVFYKNSLKNYQQDPKMSYVINSVLAIVNGLDKVHQNVSKKN